MDSETNQNSLQAFEPTLALVEMRIALLRQERRFHPSAPMWVLFHDAELKAMFGTEEKK